MRKDSDHTHNGRKVPSGRKGRMTTQRTDMQQRRRLSLFAGCLSEMDLEGKVKSSRSKLGLKIYQPSNASNQSEAAEPTIDSE